MLHKLGNCLVNKIKSAFLHRTGREIPRRMWDENDGDMSHLHTLIWELLMECVREGVGKRGEDILGTHPICTPAERERESNEL